MPELLESPIGVLVSGGLDSCILLAKLLAERRAAQPFYVRAGLAWEAAELAALRRFLESLSSSAGGRLKPLVVFDMPLADLYADHWSVTGRGVPDDRTPDEAVFLPGRNALLAIKPLVWCQMHGLGELALGALGSNPFPDASDAFFEAFQAALNQGAERPVRIVRPLANLHKADVMRLGRELPLELTFSCIAPIDGLHCGHCNKCGERKEAFRAAEMSDPTRYAEHRG